MYQGRQIMAMEHWIIAERQKLQEEFLWEQVLPEWRKVLGRILHRELYLLR